MADSGENPAASAAWLGTLGKAEVEPPIVKDGPFVMRRMTDNEGNKLPQPVIVKFGDDRKAQHRDAA